MLHSNRKNQGEGGMVNGGLLGTWIMSVTLLFITELALLKATLHGSGSKEEGSHRWLKEWVWSQGKDLNYHYATSSLSKFKHRAAFLCLYSLIYKIDIIVLRCVGAIKWPNHRKCQDGQLVAISQSSATITLRYLYVHKDCLSNFSPMGL